MSILQIVVRHICTFSVIKNYISHLCAVLSFILANCLKHVKIQHVCCKSQHLHFNGNATKKRIHHPQILSTIVSLKKNKGAHAPPPHTPTPPQTNTNSIHTIGGICIISSLTCQTLANLGTTLSMMMLVLAHSTVFTSV